jgi:hypothetical protein
VSPRVAPASAPGELELVSADALRAEPTPLSDDVFEEAEEELTPLVEEASPAEPAAAAPLTSPERALLEALDRLAEGGHAEPEIVKPTQAIAVLIRILVRKGIVSERELLDALRRDEG